MNPALQPTDTGKRLLSLDFMRGMIMILLTLESCGLYDSLNDATQGHAINGFIQEFFHHPWNGLRFWDLVQPSFMFMAGTAMAISLHKQQANAVPWSASFRKTLRRCGWLFFWGVFDYSVRPNGLSFELWDVLTQLSFTTLVAFLIFRWSTWAQIAFCAGLLLLTEALYRFTHVPGFDQPFTDQHNFGNYMDWILMRKINPAGWVAINCIPTAVHTIAGCLVGKLLLSDKKKVPIIFAWAAICLALGFGLDWLGITPIIKRIATSSFTLASLGWALVEIGLFYWWIDVRKHQKYLLLVTVIGMNSIFIYLFNEIVGDRWFTGYIHFICNNIMGYINTPLNLMHIISAFCVFTLNWLLCYFLYKKKIFFRL